MHPVRASKSPIKQQLPQLGYFMSIITILSYNFTTQTYPSDAKLPKISGTYRQIRPKNYWKLWHSKSSNFDWRNYIAIRLMTIIQRKEL